MTGKGAFFSSCALVALNAALGLAVLVDLNGARAFQDADPNEQAAETVLFSADRVIRERADSPVLAEGNVEAFFGSQTLKADQVTYDPDSDIVIAKGNVVIFDADGQTFFADEVELTGDLKDGVASNVTTLIGEQSRLAGNTAVRRSNGVNDVNGAAYTACSVCNEDGSKKTPTWQINAARVTQDDNEKMIRFRNATVKVLGVPVLYTPYLEFPDPSVKRKSGFLTPRIATSSRLGVEVETPYYIALSDHQDITLSPRILTELGFLMQAEYRVQRHDAGAIFQGGLIDPRSDPVQDDQIESGGEVDDSLTGLRWHLFGSAYKELANDWRAEVDIDYVSDKTYLRTYDIEPEGDLREATDVLQPDRLENELSFTRDTGNTFTDISTILFQSLRTSEDNAFMADALPRIRHSQRMDLPGNMGRLTYGTDLLLLHRPSGLDSMRATGRIAYEKTHTTRGGHRLRGFAELRGDAYRYTDADQGVQACNVGENSPEDYEECRENLPRLGLESEYGTSRFLPTAGIEWSYPLAKFTDKATIVIEPKVQAVVSTDARGTDDYLDQMAADRAAFIAEGGDADNFVPTAFFQDDVFNEDSQFFQFDTLSLFDWTKSSGLDQWEDGQRLNVGVNASAIFNNGVSIAGTVGQQFRVEESALFDPDSGLGDTSSDYVGSLDVKLGSRLSVENRFRFDDENGTLRRGESTVRARYGKTAAALSYLRVDTQEFGTTGERDEFLTASATYRINDQWLVGGTLRENLESGQTTNQSLRLQYRDDCTIFSLDYRFDNRLSDGLDRNQSLTFNVELVGF